MTKLLTEKEVSAEYGVKIKTLQMWRWRRQGPAFIRISSRAVRYERSEIEAWLDRCRVAPRDENL